MTTGPTVDVDRAAERLSRWTAARFTRRSFFHRAGQVAMMVAAGPAIASVLTRQAEARVCGQSGVTPKCETFDCVGVDDVWGWCWYASDGCCANNGLKKICDCCTVNYPNVHGYCPSGTNVRCIVESCGEDPRLLRVELLPVAWRSGAGYHHAAIRAAHPSSSIVVVASAADRWAQVLAAPLAGTLGAPLLPVPAAGLGADDRALLAEIGAGRALVVGATTTETTASLTSAGLLVDAIGADAPDRETLSVVVADRIRAINDINRSVTVATTGLSGEAFVLAASFAAVNGFPIAIGAGAADAIGMPTLHIGPEPGTASAVPGERTRSTNLADLSIELADLAAASPQVNANRITIAPTGQSDLIGLVNLGAPIALHPLNQLGPLAKWLETHSLRYGLLERVGYVDGPGQLTIDQYWLLQGMVNGFRVDQLQGVSGQGLPVIRQPWAERPIGRARIDGALSFGSEGSPGYWTAAGQTFRG